MAQQGWSMICMYRGRYNIPAWWNLMMSFLFVLWQLCPHCSYRWNACMGHGEWGSRRISPCPIWFGTTGMFDFHNCISICLWLCVAKSYNAYLFSPDEGPRYMAENSMRKLIKCKWCQLGTIVFFFFFGLGGLEVNIKGAWFFISKLLEVCNFCNSCFHHSHHALHL